MKRIVYLIAYPLLWMLSRLPFAIFYKVSDAVYGLVYHLVRYRRKTVAYNLKLAFPEKADKERATIERKFYKHMVDMFLEMIKSLNISDAQLKERFIITNIEELQRIYKKDKSILLACGHYASYEWMNAMQLYPHHYTSFAVYKQIKNPYFDKLVRRIREKYDTNVVSSRDAVKVIARNQLDGLLGIYAMIADQSPKLQGAKFWTPFMGITVPVFMGTETLARKYDMAVVYLHVEKVKRGHYVATFKPITTTAKQEEPYQITRRYFDHLEAQIQQAPEFYLWTHKRWKHKDAPIPEQAEVF